jgi:hypothetical protein
MNDLVITISDTRPSAIRIALAGWRDALRAITHMMLVAGVALLLTLVLEAAIQSLRAYSPTIELVVLPLYWVAQSLVLIPLAIAVQRYVLLEEVTPRYAIDLSDRRFRQYFGFAVRLQGLWLILWVWFFAGHFVFGWPPLPGEPIAPGAAENLGWILLAGFAGPMLTCFVILTITVSVAILFPAVAIDAPAAAWRNARNDSEGHISRMFWAFALGLAPIAPLDIIFTREYAVSHPAFEVVAVVWSAVKSVLIVSAFAAIASTFYVAYGKRLKRAAPSA